MRVAEVRFRGVAPYSASHVVSSPKNKGEKDNDYEERTWRERLNVDENGQAIIPAMAFKIAVDTAAGRYAGKIPGKGNATWRKYFEAGVLVFEHVPIPGVTRENVQHERLFVPSDGVPGGGKRVWKKFPRVPEDKWGGVVTFHVLDEMIDKPIFEQIVRQAFALVGLGRFRPEKRGFYGRAEVEDIAWS